LKLPEIPDLDMYYLKHDWLIGQSGCDNWQLLFLFLKMRLHRIAHLF